MRAARAPFDSSSRVPICLLALLAGCSEPQPRPFVVASKSSIEQTFLAEVAAQYLERKLDTPVARRLNWGETAAVHTALVGGEIDVYPEYGCAAISMVLNVDISTDRAIVLERVREGYARRFRVIWLDPLGYDNRFQVAVLKSIAAKHKMKNLSDLSRRTEGWSPGMTREARSRRDGFPLLDVKYQLTFRAPPAALDSPMFARALSEQRIDLVMAEAANIVFAREEFQVLEDDSGAFPPCEASFVLRSDADFAYPGVRRTLSELSGKFSLESVRAASLKVIEGHVAVDVVASGFLREAGLVP